MITAPIPRARTSSGCIAPLLLLCALFLLCRGTYGFCSEHHGCVARVPTTNGRRVTGPSCWVPPRLRRDTSVHPDPERSLFMSTSPSPGPATTIEDPRDGRDEDGAFEASAPTGVEEARRLRERASELRRQADAASAILDKKKVRDEMQRAVNEPARSQRLEASSDPRNESGFLASSNDRGGARASSSSPFALPPASASAAVPTPPLHEYRLHVDIGREPGSWMEPRWGASERRIEFTVDVRFTGSTVEGGTGEDGTQQQHASSSLVKDGGSKGWFGPPKRPLFSLETAPYARMRSGFDRMRCLGGAYRIERDASEKSRDATVRFCVHVEGTTDYGDVTIPPGYLYFSIPAFSSKLSLLSRKPGPVTVRQQGWNTGWRREESRIVGVFLATPLQRS